METDQRSSLDKALDKNRAKPRYFIRASMLSGQTLGQYFPENSLTILNGCDVVLITTAEGVTRVSGDDISKYDTGDFPTTTHEGDQAQKYLQFFEELATISDSLETAENSAALYLEQLQQLQSSGVKHGELESLGAQIQELSARAEQAARLETEVTQLGSEIQRLTQQITDNQENSLATEALQQELEAAKTRIVQVEEENRAVQEQLEQTRTQVTTVIQEKTEAISRAEKAESSLAEEQSAHTETRRQLTLLRESIRKVEDLPLEVQFQVEAERIAEMEVISSELGAHSAVKLMGAANNLTAIQRGANHSPETANKLKSPNNGHAHDLAVSKVTEVGGKDLEAPLAKLCRTRRVFYFEHGEHSCFIAFLETEKKPAIVTLSAGGDGISSTVAQQTHLLQSVEDPQEKQIVCIVIAMQTGLSLREVADCFCDEPEGVEDIPAAGTLEDTEEVPPVDSEDKHPEPRATMTPEPDPEIETEPEGPSVEEILSTLEESGADVTQITHESFLSRIKKDPLVKKFINQVRQLLSQKKNYTYIPHASDPEYMIVITPKHVLIYSGLDQDNRALITDSGLFQLTISENHGFGDRHPLIVGHTAFSLFCTSTLKNPAGVVAPENLIAPDTEDSLSIKEIEAWEEIETVMAKDLRNRLRSKLNPPIPVQVAQLLTCAIDVRTSQGKQKTAVFPINSYYRIGKTGVVLIKIAKDKFLLSSNLSETQLSALEEHSDLTPIPTKITAFREGSDDNPSPQAAQLSPNQKKWNAEMARIGQHLAAGDFFEGDFTIPVQSLIESHAGEATLTIEHAEAAKKIGAKIPESTGVMSGSVLGMFSDPLVYYSYYETEDGSLVVITPHDLVVFKSPPEQLRQDLTSSLHPLMSIFDTGEMTADKVAQCVCKNIVQVGAIE